MRSGFFLAAIIFCVYLPNQVLALKYFYSIGQLSLAPIHFSSPRLNEFK